MDGYIVKRLVFMVTLLSCGDDYMTIEHNVIDTENNIPIYFYAEATHSDGVNTWKPIFTYYIYQMEEGIYDAYFHPEWIANVTPMAYVSVEY